MKTRPCFVRLERMDEELMTHYLKKYNLKTQTSLAGSRRWTTSNEKENQRKLSSKGKRPKKIRKLKDECLEDSETREDGNNNNLGKFELKREKMFKNEKRKWRKGKVGSKEKICCENSCGFGFLEDAAMESTPKKGKESTSATLGTPCKFEEIVIKSECFEIESGNAVGHELQVDSAEGGEECSGAGWSGQEDTNPVNTSRTEFVGTSENGDGYESRDENEDDKETVIFEPNLFEKEERDVSELNREIRKEIPKTKNGSIMKRKKQKLIKFKRKRKMVQNFPPKGKKVKEKPINQKEVKPKEKLTSEKFFDEKVVQEVCMFVKGLSDSRKIIEQLKKDMPENGELAGHFKTVISAQEENFRKEIWKNRETVMRGYHRMLSLSRNPKDVTVEISKRTLLSMEEVDGVIFECVHCEGTCARENSEKSKEVGEVRREASPQQSVKENFFRTAPSNNFSENLRKIWRTGNGEVASKGPSMKAVQCSGGSIRNNPNSIGSVNLRYPYFICGNPKTHPAPVQKLTNLMAAAVAPPAVYSQNSPRYQGNTNLQTRRPPQTMRPEKRNYYPQQLTQFRQPDASCMNQNLYSRARMPAPLMTLNVQRPTFPQFQGGYPGHTFTSPSQGPMPPSYGDATLGCRPRGPPPPYHSQLNSKSSVYHNSVPVENCGFSRSAATGQIMRNQPVAPEPRPLFPPGQNLFVSNSMPRGPFTRNPGSQPLRQDGFAPGESFTNDNSRGNMAPNGSSTGKTLLRIIVPHTSPLLKSFTESGCDGSNRCDRPSEEPTVFDPTIPQKLTLKNQRLQAESILKPESDTPREEDQKRNPSPEKIAQRPALSPNSRVYICAEGSCQNQGSWICKDCKSVIYCSVNCQINHWNSKHKNECRELKELRG